MKRIFGAILVGFCLCFTEQAAGQIQHNGVWYDVSLSTNTATVVQPPIYATNPYYSGDVEIPSTFEADVNDLARTFTVTGIEERAFASCIDITSIIIPGTVTHIGKLAFWYCSNLMSITIPSSVTSIEYGAFLDCTGLTSISIPGSITHIGEVAFAGCSGLTSINIHNSVTSIGVGAFAGCSGLTFTVHWNNPIDASNVFSDANYNFDFAGCTLKVPAGRRAAYKAAAVWKEFGTIIDHGDVSVNVPRIEFAATNPAGRTVTITTNYNWTATKKPADASWLTITPESGAATANSFTVAAVDNSPNAAGNEAEIIVANGYYSDTIKVTQLGNGIFDIAPTTPLTFAYNDATVRRIDVTTSATWTIVKDPWIIINPNPASPLGNGNGYFTIGVTMNTGAERKGKVTITNTITQEKKSIDVTQNSSPYLRLSVDTLYFGANESLTQGVTVTSNDYWTVGVNVSWVTLSANAGRGNGNFYATAETNTGDKRKGIITVTCFGKSYTIHVEQKASSGLRFKDGNFYYYGPDRNGTTVEVVASTDGGKYSGKITIPATATDPETGKSYNVTKIGERAFYYCSRVTSVTIPNSVVEIGDRAFAYCDRLASVGIPNSVERIGEWAFSNCTNLASVEIPRSVKKIMNGAFDGCSKLASISIPNTVTEVASMAFYNCSKLTIMHVYWDTPPNVSNINPDFSDYTHCTLYVPYGKKREYQYAWYWSNFVDIIERSTTGTDEVTTESAITVRAEAGRLYVDSPTAETVYVYSFTGKLLHVATKEAGKAIFDVPSEKLLIVRGSSGWARKLMAN